MRKVYKNNQEHGDLRGSAKKSAYVHGKERNDFLFERITRVQGTMLK